MPSWTPFPATVLAIGLSAAGASSAAADPAPEMPGAQAADQTAPDQTTPDQTTIAPVHTCQVLHGVGHGLEAAPCLDTDLGMRIPNPAMNPDLARTVHTLGDSSRGADPVQRVVGGVLSSQAAVNSLAKTRPTVDLNARPDYTGALEPQQSAPSLLGAEVGPHQPNQDGVSAVDTVSQVDAVHGYDLRPGIGVLGVAKPLTDPLRDALTG